MWKKILKILKTIDYGFNPTTQDFYDWLAGKQKKFPPIFHLKKKNDSHFGKSIEDEAVENEKNKSKLK